MNIRFYVDGLHAWREARESLTILVGLTHCCLWNLAAFAVIQPVRAGNFMMHTDFHILFSFSQASGMLHLSFLFLSLCLLCGLHYLHVSAFVHAGVHCVLDFFRLFLHNKHLGPWHGMLFSLGLPVCCADYFPVWIIIVILRLPVWTQHPISWIDQTLIHHTCSDPVMQKNG